MSGHTQRQRHRTSVLFHRWGKWWLDDAVSTATSMTEANMLTYGCDTYRLIASNNVDISTSCCMVQMLIDLDIFALARSHRSVYQGQQTVEVTEQAAHTQTRTSENVVVAIESPDHSYATSLTTISKNEESLEDRTLTSFWPDFDTPFISIVTIVPLVPCGSRSCSTIAKAMPMMLPRNEMMPRTIQKRCFRSDRE